MKKNLVIILAALALVTTACGSNASYRGVKRADAPTPTEVNDPAEPSLEEKAMKILSEDYQNKAFNSTLLSDIMATEVRGLTVSIIKDVKDDGLPTITSKIKVSFYSLINNACVASEKSSASFKTIDLAKDFIKISGGGRFLCLEQTCENAMVMIEEARAVDVTADDGSVKKEMQSGSLAVLVKKSDDGSYKPVTTESTAFSQLWDVKMGEINCIDEVTQKIYDDAQKAKEEAAAKATPAPEKPAFLDAGERHDAVLAALVAKEEAKKVKASPAPSPTPFQTPARPSQR